MIRHGGCLGLGLASMGTQRADVYEQLKFHLYQVDCYLNHINLEMYIFPYTLHQPTPLSTYLMAFCLLFYFNNLKRSKDLFMFLGFFRRLGTNLLKIKSSWLLLFIDDFYPSYSVYYHVLRFLTEFCRLLPTWPERFTKHWLRVRRTTRWRARQPVWPWAWRCSARARNRSSKTWSLTLR